MNHRRRTKASDSFNSLLEGILLGMRRNAPKADLEGQEAECRLLVAKQSVEGCRQDKPPEDP